MAAYVVGHMNPDTDSIVAAIAVADLMSKRGIEAVPAAQGETTPETNFVLDKFGGKAPEVITDAEGKQIVLVDHSDIAQTVANLDKGELLAIVDHHKLGDVTTPNPLEIWVHPVGCSCTVVKMMYDFYGIEIPKNIAGMMTCAILSDTVMFKSPTCTAADKQAVDALAKVAGVADVQALGIDMFKVKSDFSSTPADKLVNLDYKEFNMSGNKVGIGQIEAIDGSLFEPIKADVLAEVKKMQAAGMHSVLLLLTDIMKEGSELLIATSDAAPIEKAFGVKVDGDSVWLEGVLSRKKQVVPPLEKAFG